MTKRNIVIVGGNRGIGLEFCKQYKEKGDNVICFVRKSSPELASLGVKVIEGIDVKKDESIEAMASSFPENKIDILIHNAGILNFDSFSELSLESFREQFEVNSLGPLKSVLALQKFFVEGTKIGLVSSRVGSIEDNSSSNNYGYRTSKTALNMIGKCLSIDLKDQGVAVRLLHPGYVKTDMTNGNGNIEADEAASGLIERMEELSLESTGEFHHSNGERLPW
jgi:NAD(P)-dependent dehydrogenase (short-subunit alcohol dehydrogenase family)